MAGAMRRRMRAWVIGWLAVAGCSPAASAAFVPDAVVDAAIVQRVGATRSSWDWRVSVGARWSGPRPAPASPARDVDVPALAGVPGPIPCADPSLCDWERRARLRALERLLGRSR